MFNRDCKKILSLKEEHARLIGNTRNPSNGLKLLERLFEEPIVTTAKVAKILGVTYPTANSLISEFCDLGLLNYDSRIHRNRKFFYKRYIDLLQVGTELEF